MRIMLVADKNNSRYYGQAKQVLDGHTVMVPKASFNILSLYIKNAKQNRVDAIILSHCLLLSKLVKQKLGKDVLLKQGNRTLTPSANWAGAMFEVEGVKVIISRPFKQLVTIPYAKFLLRWYTNKHLNPRFVGTPPMHWCNLNHHNIQGEYELFQNALYIAVDIETKKTPISEVRAEALRAKGHNLSGIYALMNPKSSGKNYVNCIPEMDMIGYCGLFRREDGSLYSKSIVLTISSMEDIYWMRKFNSLSAPKITQNGGYEASYLIRYNAPLKNWLCDTFHFMHSWYAELPRTLDFITSLFISDYEYWKDEMASNREEYNAKDTHNTLWCWVLMVNMAPQWAKDNYLIEFRKVFPAITSGLEGFKVDEKERDRLREHHTKLKNKAEESLSKICWPYFNAGSAKQVLTLLNAMSVVKYKSSDDKALRKFSEQGPLCAKIAELITSYREHSKKLSTYINSRLFEGRLLYEVNHGGTDTGRAASKASNFWVGTQIQNQDNSLRSMYVADDGWVIANCDGSQAESRCTAYISEDPTLIDSVENAPDFHTRNASLFFGIPEDEIVQNIYDEEGNFVGKDKALRTLSKRVNHGSNYNMGASVLLETMGISNVLNAKHLLNLPQHYSLIDVCKYLLGTFNDTYPLVKGKYYDEVIEEIRITSRLVGPTGWTRYCFELPSKTGNKPVLNKYVAHPPQSLSVMLVDEAEFDFWYEWQIKKNKVRLKAQVHDEVVFQVRPEDDKEARKALSKLLARPVEVRGRTMVIPNDGGNSSVCWGDLKD